MPSPAPDTAADRYRAAPVERIDAGDAVLACRRFGRGPALVLVHGFPLHGFTWRHVVARLADDFTCVTVDLAGLGDSEWTTATDFDFPAQARRLRIAIDRLGIGPYHLMAQDTGATIARCLALLDPERVRRLVMINTEIPGHRPPWIREYQALMRLPGAGFVFRQLLRSSAFVRSGMGFGGCFADPALLDGEFAAAFVEPYVRSARRTEGLGRYLLGIRWDVVDAFARRHAELRLPVLCLWGEDDPTFPVALGHEMSGRLPDGRFVAIPGTRLLPHEERPDDVAAATRAFLSGAASVSIASRADAS